MVWKHIPEFALMFVCISEHAHLYLNCSCVSVFFSAGEVLTITWAVGWLMLGIWQTQIRSVSCPLLSNAFIAVGCSSMISSCLLYLLSAALNLCSVMLSVVWSCCLLCLGYLHGWQQEWSWSPAWRYIWRGKTVCWRKWFCLFAVSWDWKCLRLSSVNNFSQSFYGFVCCYEFGRFGLKPILIWKFNVNI